MNTYEVPVIDLSDIPQVPSDTMNETHTEEIVLINQLGLVLQQAMQGDQSNLEITEKLAEWIEHTREHFAHENQLMEECGFPAYAIHRNEHQLVLEQIEGIQQQWLNDQLVEPVADYVFNEWLQWFENHVNTMDLVTAQYLSQAVPDA